MKKEELKQLIKPLVKECVEESVKEIVLNSGLLSQVINEVVKGMSPIIAEAKIQQPKQEITAPSRYAEVLQRSEKTKLSETRKNLKEIIGQTSYAGVNVFEGITDTIPDETHPLATGPANPMNGISPNDPGVDISSLFDFNKAIILAKGKKR